MTATVVSDYVIWAKHLDGDTRARVLSLRAGEVLTLAVDGVVGAWRKMDDGRDGRPTPGLKPVGRTADFWRDLYDRRRGEMVDVDLADGDRANTRLPIYPALAKTEEERRASIDAFLAAGEEGWRSEGPYGPRDELYDR